MFVIVRGLILFVVGAIVGAAALFFFSPDYTIVVTRTPSPSREVRVVALAKPTPSMIPAGTPAVKPSTSVTAPVVAGPALNFEAIAERMSLWPASVAVQAITSVEIKDDEGKKSRDLPLEAGTVLQVSKVRDTGLLEVRAKGAKFDIPQERTNFDAIVRQGIAELLVKNPQFVPPYQAIAAASPTMVAAPVAPVPPAAVILVAASTAVTPATVTPTAVARGPLTLEDKINIFFGHPTNVEVKIESKPVAPIDAAPVVPVAPAATSLFGKKMKAEEAPAVPAMAPMSAPVPSADSKTAEKAADLDRKMNQLFKK